MNFLYAEAAIQALVSFILKNCIIAGGFHPCLLGGFGQRFIVRDHFVANGEALLIFG